MTIDRKKLEKDLVRDLKKTVDLRKAKSAELVPIARDFLKEMKAFISKGISPIKGKGRFPRYKNPSNYPNSRSIRKKFPLKRQRPVNLYLSGEFLKDLKINIFNGKILRFKVGFFNKDSIIKERGHREGANGQPKRPIIPKNTESFTPALIQNFEKDILKLFNVIIRR